MQTFKYIGVAMLDDAIIEIQGIQKSLNINTAQQELAACGLRILELRQATAEDIRIERFKKLQQRLQNMGKPPVKVMVIEKPERKSFLGRLLNIFK